jgi:hypothetical protein
VCALLGLSEEVHEAGAKNGVVAAAHLNQHCTGSRSFVEEIFQASDKVLCVVIGFARDGEDRRELLQPRHPRKCGRREVFGPTAPAVGRAAFAGRDDPIEARPDLLVEMEVGFR